MDHELGYSAFAAIIAYLQTFLFFVQNRVSSPTDRYSPVTTTKRVVEKRSNYKMYSSYSGSQDNLDQSSPLSSLETDRIKRYGSPSK